MADPVNPHPERGRSSALWWIIALIVLALIIWWFMGTRTP